MKFFLIILNLAKRYINGKDFSVGLYVKPSLSYLPFVALFEKRQGSFSFYHNMMTVSAFGSIWPLPFGMAIDVEKLKLPNLLFV